MAELKSDDQRCALCGEPPAAHHAFQGGQSGKASASWLLTELAELRGNLRDTVGNDYARVVEDIERRLQDETKVTPALDGLVEFLAEVAANGRRLDSIGAHRLLVRMGAIPAEKTEAPLQRGKLPHRDIRVLGCQCAGCEAI